LIFNFKFTSCKTCVRLSDYFVAHFDVNYGNCYVFNTGAAARLKKTSVPGSAGGSLSLDYYVGFHENLTLFNAFTSKTWGAIVRIENNTYLTDNSFGSGDIHLASGRKFWLKIKRSFEFSLPKPYSNCDIPNNDDSNNDQLQALYSIYTLFARSAYQYTREACFVQCYQQRLVQNCNCSDPKFFSLFANVSVCSLNDVDSFEYECQKVNFPRGIIKWNECLNVFPLECNRTEYGIDITFSELNNDFYEFLLRQSAILMSDDGSFKATKPPSQRFVSFNIFYDTLSYELVVEMPKMNLVELIASIGGNLSLFVGVSIFTLFEVVEIVLEICLIKIKQH